MLHITQWTLILMLHIRQMFWQMFYLLHFWCSTLHLMKSAQHCLYNTGKGRYTRCIRNNEMFILWNHISAIFYEDREYCLHILPKLSNEHIMLTPYSKIHVRLTTQVLSSASKVLTAYSPPEAAETSRFCSLMDWFFDIMNIQNNQSLEFEQKSMLAPFRSVNDRRFSWLRYVFLKSFQDWLNSVQQRFITDTGQKMFISWQKYEGLKTSVNSLINATQFLLWHQVFHDVLCNNVVVCDTYRNS